MRTRFIRVLSALAVAATMLITSCGKSDEVVTPEPPKEVKTYNIIFGANGGEGIMENQVVEEKTQTALAENSFTREEFTFSGWNTKADGSGESYADKAKVSLTADLALYAQWIADAATTYQVTFDANGGEGTMESQVVEEDVQTALTANGFTREEFTFSGWNTKADGSGESYDDGAKVSLSADLVLYAQWSEVVVTAEAGITVNGVNKPFTGVALMESDTPEAAAVSPKVFAFSASHSQADVEGGVLLDEIAEGDFDVETLKWSGYIISSNMTDVDLAKTPEAGNKFSMIVVSEENLYIIEYNTYDDGKTTVIYGEPTKSGAVTLESGSISYNLSGNTVSIDLDITLSNGHTIRLIHDGEVPDMQLPIEVEEIKLDKESLPLKVGETGKVSITAILPEDAENKEVEWSSNNKEVATVDQEGNVTALKVGTAKISVTAQDYSSTKAECLVTVTEVEVPKPGITVNGVNKPFTGIALVDEDDDITTSDVLYFSGYRSQANVESGDLMFDFRENNANLEEMQWSGFISSDNMTNVDLTQTSDSDNELVLIFVSGDGSYMIFYNVLGHKKASVRYGAADGSVSGEVALESGTISYNQTDNKVTLDLDMKLANGHTVRLIHDGEVPKAQMPVEVEDIKLDKESMTLSVGAVGKISITAILPEDAYKKEVKWNSSNEEVATVDQEGNVTALKVGEASIYAKAQDGSGIFESCKVKVIAPTGITPPDIVSGGNL